MFVPVIIHIIFDGKEQKVIGEETPTRLAIFEICY